MKGIKCKNLKERTKMIITKMGVLYGKEYKCELRTENYVSAKKICCRKCPKQLELFENYMDEKRLNK